MKCKRCDAYKFLFLAAVFDTDIGFATFAEALEWKVLKIRLNFGIVEFATDKTFYVKDTIIQVLGETNKEKEIDQRVVRVHGNLVLCGITDQTLIIGEGDVGRSCSISLVVCNDFYTIILPYTHATKGNIITMDEKRLRVICSRVGCAKVDTDSFRHDDKGERLECALRRTP